MNECGRIQEEFSAYLDGAISGATMQRIASHLSGCAACGHEFAQWRSAHSLLGSIGSAKAPEGLGLQLRVALSQERSHTFRANLSRWGVRWQNTLRPLILQASAGFASAVILVGSVTLLVGMFASPEPLSARDQPVDTESGPRFLYSSFQPGQIGSKGNPVIVEAFIGGDGRVYDYKIVSGAADLKTRSQLDSALLFSVFEPARSFGQPVRGIIILSYSGVSVRG